MTGGDRVALNVGLYRVRGPVPCDVPYGGHGRKSKVKGRLAVPVEPR